MKKSIIAAAFCLPLFAQAKVINVPIDLIASDGSKKPIGQVVISETKYGVLFTPQLSHLPSGIHGFHVHENPSCDAIKNEKDGTLQIAQAAGGHLDIKGSKQHLGPYDDLGHVGDLPALYVDEQGNANYPVLAPRIKSLQQITNRALMIHAGGDNHSDKPLPLGGGGARLACGVITN